VPPGFDEVPLLWPSDIWMKMCELWQPKRLEWWLIDLIDEKKKTRKLRKKVEEK
jgi:hypothetical protein